MTEWVVAPLAVAAAFWLPGVVVLRVAGLRLRVVDLGALAPAVTIGVFALGAESARPLGVRWGLPAAAVSLAVACVVVAPLGLRARRRSPSAAERRKDPARLRAAVLVAIAVQLGVVLQGQGDPRRLLAAFDAGAHITMLRGVVETGQASALTVAGIGELDGVPRMFYPAGWHTVAALAVPAGGTAATFTWAYLLPSAVAWTCGVVMLTRVVFPNRPAILPWAALMTVPGAALPLTLTLWQEGMVPNSVGVALVPGVLAWLVGGRRTSGDRLTGAAVAVIAVIGLGAVHPNTVLSLALLGTGWWVPWLARTVRQAWTAGRRGPVLAGACGVALAVAGVVGFVAHSPETRGVLMAHGGEPTTPAVALGHLMTLDATGQTTGFGLLPLLAGVLGGLLVRRRRGRPLVVSAIVVVVFYLLASSTLPVVSWLDAPWYDEARRYSAVIVAGVLPLGAYGAHAAVRAMAARVSLSWRPFVRLGVPLLALLGVAVPASADLSELVAKSYASGHGWAVIADDDELALLARLPSELDGGAVLSSPFSGGTYLYALSAYPTVPRTYLMKTPPPALAYLGAHLDDLGTDPEVCADLDALGVRYLYVDPMPWHTWDPLDLTTAPKQGVRLVDQAGDVRVLEVTACG